MNESELSKIIDNLQQEVSYLKRRLESIEKRNYKIDLRRKILK